MSIDTATMLARPVGGDGTPLGSRLQNQLEEPRILRAGSGVSGQELTGITEIASAITMLTAAQTASDDVMINVFQARPSPEVRDLQRQFLETCLLAMAIMVMPHAAASSLSEEQRRHNAAADEALIDSIVRLAASASPAGRVFRGMLATPERQPAPRDPPKGGVLPGLPGIPGGLLQDADRLRRRGCAKAVKSAMRTLGRALRAVAPKYRGTVNSLQPADNCPTEEMTITGHDFGDGSRAAVVFTAAGGRVLLVPASDALEWSNARIRLLIPIDAIRGPIGILQFPATQASLADAAGQVISEIGTCFGPNVLIPMEQRLGRIAAPPLLAPPIQPNRANLYIGGPPVIKEFAVSPSGPLWSGRTIWLRWDVEGADAIQISRRDVPGSAPQELPGVAGPLPERQGGISVVVRATGPWRGQYVLSARNRCTTRMLHRDGRSVALPWAGAVEGAVDLEMVFRRGLALGGGGSRGDFQVGALLYLYDEKGFRPDAIAGTSVGAINAVDLAKGDEAPTATNAGRSAAARLATFWLNRTTELSMWDEEPWLKKHKQDVRTALGSISLKALLSSWYMLYMVVNGIATILDLKDTIENPRKNGVVALFNISPIEQEMRAVHGIPRTPDQSGIKLRLVSVSSETGHIIMVDEKGLVLREGPDPTLAYGAGSAPSTDVIDGAIASAAMPGIFPARRLGNHMCVDGGVRDVVPARVAVKDLGCNVVMAIRTSARPPLWETDPFRPPWDLMSRSVLEWTFDEVADDDVGPFGGWAEGVQVVEIRPSFNLHDPMVIAPGLIRIAIDYGWMRAADVLDVDDSYRRYARELSDRITVLRANNWFHTHRVANVVAPDPHRGFGDFLVAGFAPPTKYGGETKMIAAESIDAIRANCRMIRDVVARRLAINAPVPPPVVRSRWFTEWELIATPPSEPNPWVSFPFRNAETPPAPI